MYNKGTYTREKLCKGVSDEEELSSERQHRKINDECHYERRSSLNNYNTGESATNIMVWNNAAGQSASSSMVSIVRHRQQIGNKTRLVCRRLNVQIVSRLSLLCPYQTLQNRYLAVMVERKDNANSALYHEFSDTLN